MLKVDIKKKIGTMNLEISFEAGNEVLAILGASGCGKSMTLKCITGIVTPDSGYIELDGRVLFDSVNKINLPIQERKIGYLFQQYALFPTMTIYENIAFAIRKNKGYKEQVASLLKTFHLDKQAEKYPHQLSGGQQQRVALARMLATKPKLILLDEPLSALDDYLKYNLEMELQNTLCHIDGTALFVSHNISEVIHLCHKVCVLDKGKSQKVITVDQLTNSPETVSAALLSGCKNFSHATYVNDHEVLAVDWNVRLQSKQVVPKEIRFVGFSGTNIVLTPKGKEKNRIDVICEQVLPEVGGYSVRGKTCNRDNKLSNVYFFIPYEFGELACVGERIPIAIEEVLLFRE